MLDVFVAQKLGSMLCCAQRSRASRVVCQVVSDIGAPELNDFVPCIVRNRRAANILQSRFGGIKYRNKVRANFDKLTSTSYEFIGFGHLIFLPLDALLDLLLQFVAGDCRASECKKPMEVRNFLMGRRELLFQIDGAIE